MNLRSEKHACFLVPVVLLAMAVGGCASPISVRPTEPQVVEMEPENAEKGWWGAGFSMPWPENAEPSWHMDLFIAHRVVAPVLYRYKQRISLWRFHRRALRDKMGHRFGFAFYGSRETATEVFSSLRSDPLLKEMRTAGLVVQDTYDDTSVISNPNIEDTSDGAWAPEIRKSWPRYIMGVSEMWLGLIAEVADQNSNGKGPSSIEQYAAFYEQVDGFVKELWKEQGQHAFLHHLNAIFGYEPLVIYERRLQGF